MNERQKAMKDWDKELDERIKKFDKAIMHWLFTIGFSILTALVTTLLLLK